MRIRDRLRDVRTIRQLHEAAEAEARRAGDTEPAAEHFLLAAIELPDGTARRAFATVGADPDALRGAIEAQHAEALESVGVEAAAAPPAPVAGTGRGAYRSRSSAQQVFREAGELARTTRTPLCGAHVVVAVTALEHGTAARALRALGIDPVALRGAARAAASITPG